MKDANTKRSKLDILIGAGKEMALAILRDAQATAETPQQLAGQMFAVQVSACHVLAHCAFNQEMQSKGKDGVTEVDGDAWLDSALKEIKTDLEQLRLAYERGEIQFIPAKGQKPEGIKADS